MYQFINYKNGNVSVNTHRDPSALVVDFDDVVLALSAKEQRILVCSVNGDELSLLSDGTYWNGSDATPDALEQLHTLLS